MVKLDKKIGSWVIASLILATFTSCGVQKNNKVNSQTLPDSNGVRGVSPGGVGPGFSSYYSPQVQQVKQMYPCMSGPRLQTDYTFSAGVYNNSRTTIMGPFNQGNVGGQVGAIFVGKSQWNDLMIISKVTDGGSQLLGWNVTISMCSYGNGLVSDQRPLNGFQAPKGITLAENPSCGWGDILSAQDTVMVATAVQMAGGYTLPPQQVWTTFTIAGCSSGGMYSGGSGYSGGYTGGGYP